MVAVEGSRRLLSRREIYKTSVISEGTVQVVARREHFGPGSAGSSSFRIIANGAICEYKNRFGKVCEKIALGTLDFDIFANLEQLPICGIRHGRAMANQVNRDLERQNRHTVFGINGHGRA